MIAIIKSLRCPVFAILFTSRIPCSGDDAMYTALCDEYTTYNSPSIYIGSHLDIYGNTKTKSDIQIFFIRI